MADSPVPVYPHKLRRLYWPFLVLAEACRNVVGTVAGSFRLGERCYTIPRFTLLGPVTTSSQKRLGVFALLRGNEPQGASVVLRVLEALAARPPLASGCDVVFYPVCNPTGYEDDTATNRAGRELATELWRDSDQPEPRIMEAEFADQRFDGLVTVQADPTARVLTAGIHGAAWIEGCLDQVMRSTNSALRDGIRISSAVSRVLHMNRLVAPFEIVLSTPAGEAAEDQVESAAATMLALITEGLIPCLHREAQPC